MSDEAAPGFCVRLDHVFAEHRSPATLPRWHQLRHFVLLVFRYIVWYVRMWWQGRRPFIDQISQVTSACGYGVPLGGIGGGTIGRRFGGDFARFQLRAGACSYTAAAADQFIVSVRAAAHAGGALLYQHVLNTRAPPSDGRLNRWRWCFDGARGSYRALFPRSWTRYQLPSHTGVSLHVRQISPVIPHNYQDSCLPCAVFVWTIENSSNEERDVSVTFTFENSTGVCGEGAASATPLDMSPSVSRAMLLHQPACQTDQSSTDRYLVLAINSQSGADGVSSPDTSACCFRADGDGSDIWCQLAETGSLTYSPMDAHKNLAVAVSGRCRVAASQTSQITMALVWHSPFVKFSQSNKTYTRYYSKWFDTGVEGARDMAHYALSNYDRWETEIESWQAPVLNDQHLPDWYKSALFNELYYVSDGGSLWLRHINEQYLSNDDVRREYGCFAYLESREYIMYNTYDVHFYASHVLAHLWPKLQLSLQEDIGECIAQSDDERRCVLFTGEYVPRKVANTVPHDIGSPAEAPFEKINAYQVHDVSRWKDLNLKFVLQVYRDYRVIGDGRHLRRMWPSCVTIMTRHCVLFDTDNDGMIENDASFPDQTFDTWTMHGVSAYCGGLWVASLWAVSQLAIVMDDTDTYTRYSRMLTQARQTYVQQLWTGTYYKFDSSDSKNGNSIMADQLCGHWYLRTCHVQDQVFEHVPIALRTIYEHNVCAFKQASQGAVNGAICDNSDGDGGVNTHTMQSEETWTGVTYALAATMIYEGMVQEGFRTAEGIYRTVYERIGLGFDTPEALYEEKHYRAVGYMRPLSIWTMQLAWQHYKQQQQKQTTNGEI